MSFISRGERAEADGQPGTWGHVRVTPAALSCQSVREGWVQIDSQAGQGWWFFKAGLLSPGVFLSRVVSELEHLGTEG